MVTLMHNTLPPRVLRPLSIYLGDLTYTTLSLATDAFPLNIGFIAAYAEKTFGKEINLRLFKYVEDLEQAIHEKAPDILGLSNYPWNFNLGLEFFGMTRAISPQTICVMGGPNIPLEDEARSQFVKRNPLIDFYAYLEGEEAFAALVARALETGVDREKMKSTPIDGFIHRMSDTEVMKGTMLARRRNLDEIPSPYLTGHMDKFFDGKLSPMMETNRGCPFSCTFCHEGNQLISKVNHFSIERVKAELDYIAAAVHKSPNPHFESDVRRSEFCHVRAGLRNRRTHRKDSTKAELAALDFRLDRQEQERAHCQSASKTEWLDVDVDVCPVDGPCCAQGDSAR